LSKRVRPEAQLKSETLEHVALLVEEAAQALVNSERAPDPAVAWASALGATLHLLSAKTWARRGLPAFRALRGSWFAADLDDVLAPLGIEWVGAGDLRAWNALPEVALDQVAEVYGALVGAAHAWHGPEGGKAKRSGARRSNNRYGFARKRAGVYFTPPALVDALMDALEEQGGQSPKTVLDPACGAGALLLQAQARRARSKADAGVDGLFGVDVDPLAVDLCRLRLWDRVDCDPAAGQRLQRQIRVGNALIGVPPPGVAATETALPAGVLPLDWPAAFGSVWEDGGFDWVLSNPPWERIKFQARDYLRDVAPALALLAHRAERERELLDQSALRTALAERRGEASEFSRYLHDCHAFPLSAHGDLNAYPLFVERCFQLLSASSYAGLIVPSGLATDFGHRHLFAQLHQSGRLRAFYDFENRAGFFPSVDSRFRFSLVVLGPTSSAPTQVATLLSRPGERHQEGRTWSASAEALRSLNPESCGLAMFHSASSAAVGLAMHQRVHADKGTDWDLSFHRMFDMTNHADLFISASVGETAQPDERFGWRLPLDESAAVPLYEGKLFWQHDGAYGTFEGCPESALQRGRPQTRNGLLVSRSSCGRFWVRQKDLDERRPSDGAQAEVWLAVRALTNPTNQRTLVSALIPPTAVGNSALIVRSGRFGAGPTQTLELSALLVAHFNALVVDDLARQKMGNTNVNMYLLRQLPLLPLETFERPLFGSGPSARLLVGRRSLALAMVCAPVRASIERHFPNVVGLYEEEDRAQAIAELDALFAHLYGLSEDELEACLDPPPPLKSFEVLRRQERASCGHFETKRRVLEAYRSAPRWAKR